MGSLSDESGTEAVVQTAGRCTLPHWPPVLAHPRPQASTRRRLGYDFLKSTNDALSIEDVDLAEHSRAT